MLVSTKRTKPEREAPWLRASQIIDFKFQLAEFVTMRTSEVC